MKARRFCGVVALGAAALSLTAVPGAAAPPEGVTYAGSADGQALGLSVFGQSVTLGKTHTEATSGAGAAAEGKGVFVVSGGAGETAATVSGADGTDGSADETCAGSLPAEVPGLGADLACSSSLVTVTGGDPTAQATARVGTLRVNPIAEILGTPLEDVLVGVEDGVTQLLDGLDALTDPIDDATGLGIGDTLDDAFAQLFGGADLVKVTLGTTNTTTVATGDTITTTCVAKGGRIDILDAEPVAGAVDPEPVASLIVGDATAEVVVSLSDATATPTVNPAIVTVVVPSLGLNQSIEGGQADIPLPDPLQSSISVGGGTTGETAEGQTFARASAVLIDLFNGEALQGGVELAIADCQAIAGAQVAPTTTTTTAAPVTTAAAAALPKTGGGASPLALGAAAGFAGLALVLLRRRPTL